VSKEDRHLQKDHSSFNKHKIEYKMDLRVGRQYQLVKKIGSGAFGEIYEGKTLTPRFLETF